MVVLKLERSASSRRSASLAAGPWPLIYDGRSSVSESRNSSGVLVSESDSGSDCLQPLCKVFDAFRMIVSAGFCGLAQSWSNHKRQHKLRLCDQCCCSKLEVDRAPAFARCVA